MKEIAIEILNYNWKKKKKEKEREYIKHPYMNFSDEEKEKKESG